MGFFSSEDFGLTSSECVKTGGIAVDLVLLSPDLTPMPSVQCWKSATLPVKIENDQDGVQGGFNKVNFDLLTSSAQRSVTNKDGLNGTFDSSLQDKGSWFYDVKEGQVVPLVGDGRTYSRALGWQSPEGHFYGQERWVRDWFGAAIWTGEEYKILEIDGETSDPSLLPIPGETNPRTGQPYGPRQHMEIWATPRPNWPPQDLKLYDGRNKDYWWWDTVSQSWKAVEWYWTCEGDDMLPIPGLKPGSAHIIAYYDIKMVWLGNNWQRYRHEMLDLGENDTLHLPDGFLAQNQEDIDSLVTGLGNANQTISDIETHISGIDQALIDLESLIGGASSDGSITINEANSIKLAFDQLVAESTIIMAEATAEDILVTGDNAHHDFSDSLDALELLLNSTWFIFVAGTEVLDATAYPLEITQEQRAAINTGFADTEEKKALLIQAIKDTQDATLVDGINTVKEDLVDAFKEADIPLDENWVKNVCPARIVYESPTAIGVEAVVENKVGGIWVNGQLIVDDEIGEDALTLLNTHPVLTWTESTGVIGSTALAADTEYTIYLANHVNAAYNVGGRDARGKLFLSLTPNVNGYLGLSGAGLNARAVGQINTDSSSPPKFKREIDISWIAQKTSYPETLREHCDYSLNFIDEDTIKLALTDGLYGQINIAGQLHTFGTNTLLTRDMPRVEWIEDELSYVETPISADTLYYIYACNDADQWNFNEINPATERPWQDTDTDTAIPRNYIATKDLRKTIFLSTKVQEHSLMSQTWPGYYARHIGQIVTDERGYFRYSSDLSAIRSLALNPTYLDGLAEISIYNVPGGESFKIITKRGTSGIVMVGSRAVQTFTNDDSRSDEYHTIAVSSIVYDYDQDNLSSPLTDTGDDVNLYVSRLLYIYLANDRPCWSSIVDPSDPANPIDMRNKLFVCTEAPSGNGGYLAASWPGNNARWIATIKPATGTTGSELITNRTFVDTTGWDGHEEWEWSEVNENVYHVPPASVIIDVDLDQTDCSGWSDVLGVVIDQSTPGTEEPAQIYHSISFDNKITWKVFKSGTWTSIARNNAETWQYWDGDSWEAATLNTQAGALGQATSQAARQWTKTEIDAMSSANWKATDGWSTEIETIDWAVVLINGEDSPYIADGSTNEGTDYVTDAMTSNTAPSPNSVTASSEYITPSCPAWRAFDQNESHSTDPSECWIATAKASEAVPQWLIFDFGSGAEKVINKFRLLPRNTTEPTYVAAPKDFTLAASNDNTNWTILSSVTNLTELASNTWSSYLTFSNNTAYRYYKVSITSSWGDGLTSLSQVKLIEAEYQESPTVPEFTKAAMSVHGALGQSLDQIDQEVIDHTLYELNFSVLNLTTPPEGVLTPMIGSTYGDPVTTGGPQKQYIVSSSTDILKFVPTDDSDHIIDDVSCKVVTSAAFAGAFIDDSVIGSNVAIDDEVVSSTKTWTSSKIVAATTPLPPGTIIDWAGLVIPTGWLNCNGQGLSTEEYPDLFEAISYTFGGSGSTFNVPNLNSRVTIGYDETRALGATIGEETHSLASTEIPSHNHSGTANASASSSASSGATCGSSNVAAQANSAYPLPEFTGYYTPHGYGASAVDHDHGVNVGTSVSTSVSVSVNIGSAGGSGAHNNMQPSMCLWKLIKY